MCEEISFSEAFQYTDQNQLSKCLDEARRTTGGEGLGAGDICLYKPQELIKDDGSEEEHKASPPHLKDLTSKKGLKPLCKALKKEEAKQREETPRSVAARTASNWFLYWLCCWPRLEVDDAEMPFEDLKFNEILAHCHL